MTPAGDRRGFLDLLRDLAEGGSSLVRQEIALARLELRKLLGALGVGSAMVVGGGVLALVGLLAFLTGLVLLPGAEWLRDRYWVGPLVAFVITGALAAFFAARGRALLRPERILPDQTVATIKEDAQWLRRRLTSGATSS